MTTPDPALSADNPPGEDPGVGRDFLVRSEEQLHVRTQRVAAGVARLEKFVVTETKTITVQVTHEQVRLIHEPAEENVSAPPYRDTGGQNNQARWMYLTREEIVITKRLVPVERVRLEVFEVTEQRQVTESILKEQIDTTATPAEAPIRPGPHYP